VTQRATIKIADKLNSTSHSSYLLQSTCTSWAIKTPTQTFFVIIQSNNDQFSKFFHWHTQLEICNKPVIKYLATPQARRYTTLSNINIRKLACPVRYGSLAELNLPKFWRRGRQQLLFITTYFTNFLYQFISNIGKQWQAIYLLEKINEQPLKWFSLNNIKHLLRICTWLKAVRITVFTRM